MLRCKTLGRGTNKLKLLCSYLSYMKKAGEAVKKLTADYDVVLCNQLTPVMQLHPAIKYCKKYNKKLVCYCLDLAPESGSTTIGKVPVIGKIYAAYAKWAYGKCDTIAVTSRSFIPYLHSINDVPLEKMIYLPQHASQEMLNHDLIHKKTEYAEFMFAEISETVLALKQLF